MPLCLVNGAFKPFKGPFHGKRLQGREGGGERGGLRRRRRIDGQKAAAAAR